MHAMYVARSLAPRPSLTALLPSLDKKNSAGRPGYEAMYYGHSYRMENKGFAEILIVHLYNLIQS